MDKGEKIIHLFTRVIPQSKAKCDNRTACGTFVLKTVSSKVARNSRLMEVGTSAPADKIQERPNRIISLIPPVT